MPQTTPTSASPFQANTTAPTNAVPAGWYRDPLGLPQVRWWNGMGWTNRIEERRPEIAANSKHGATLTAVR